MKEKDDDEEIIKSDQTLNQIRNSLIRGTVHSRKPHQYKTTYQKREIILNQKKFEEMKGNNNIKNIRIKAQKILDQKNFLDNGISNNNSNYYLLNIFHYSSLILSLLLFYSFLFLFLIFYLHFHFHLLFFFLFALF